MTVCTTSKHDNFKRSTNIYLYSLTNLSSLSKFKFELYIVVRRLAYQNHKGINIFKIHVTKSYNFEVFEISTSFKMNRKLK